MKNSENYRLGTLSNEFLGDCEFMPFCLDYVPNCNGPSKFSDRQVYANSVDPDQTPVPSGLQCLPFCLHLFGSLCRKMIPIKNDG